MYITLRAAFSTALPPTLIALAALAAPAARADADSAWFAQSDAMKESQPHWMTPIVTVTPRLEQEFRYDQSWQSRPGGVDVDSYGGGKGLELIPLPNVEVILGVPAYQVRDTPRGRTQGWADETLLLKYRLLSANEEQGNYIVTGFLGVSVPTGSAALTSHHALYTPTLAAGKGWGGREAGFDVQSTLAITLPDGAERTLGEPLVWNTAFQAHVMKVLWPQIEVSYTHFKDGPNAGRNQVALTGGVVLGRFALGRRARLIVGAGYQSPVSTFTTFGHTWLLTGRVAF